jgi:hypothetical protein
MLASDMKKMYAQLRSLMAHDPLKVELINGSEMLSPKPTNHFGE